MARETSVTALKAPYQIETFRTSKIVSPTGPSSCVRGGWDADAGRGRLVTVCWGSSMIFLATVSAESCGYDTGHDHQDKSDRDEGERGAPAPCLGAGVRL